MKYDFHMHSSFSHDSKTYVEEMVLSALEKGVKAVCFTEHTDYGAPADNDFDHAGLLKSVEEMNRKYNGLIDVGFGAEFGVQIETIDRTKEVVQRYPFDFVIMSCHRIGGKSFRQQFFQAGKTHIEYNRGYYEALFDCAKAFKHYNVIGHMNLISRYDALGILPFEHVRDIIAEIYRMIISEGKGIEVNTSSFRYGMNGYMPSEEMLGLYYDMGGEVITVGSDAHSPDYVADHYDDAINLLKNIGFRHVCTFKNQKPIWHKI